MEWVSTPYSVEPIFLNENLTQLIKSLFANNEQGFAYDPNDLTTMFQDAAGITKVTGAGQPVGLILDTKGTVGNNLIVNGDFSNGLNGWELSGGSTMFTAQNSRAYFNGVGTTGSFLLQRLGLQVGKTYLVTYDYEVLQGYFYCGGNYSTTYGGRNIVGSGSRQFILPVTDARDTGVSFRAENTPLMCEFYIDNVRVRELTGNHARQNTSSMRPLLAASPQRLDYDTVDDKLITNLPAQLTGCTVVRAVPNVGTQILTNQTIPTPYNDNTDHCGLIVINRALTATETSQITKLFDKAAGV